MKKTIYFICICAGAGAVNGLLGAGGGMILVPLLGRILEEKEIFPSSVAIILPITIVSLIFQLGTTSVPWQSAWPYLVGSAIGGILIHKFAKLIPTIWLHRILGLFIIAGGIRYLC